MPIIKDTAPLFYPDEKTQVSKYIDLTRFLSLLSKKALLFCRLDKLEDKFEGRTAKQNLHFRLQWQKVASHLMPKPMTDEEIFAKVQEWYDFEMKVKGVNCICCCT